MLNLFWVIATDAITEIKKHCFQEAIFFVANFRHFVKKVFEKEYSVTNSLFKKKIVKNHHNCLRYERVLRILCFNIFKYRQICLNIFMDYRCLSNIPNLRKKHCFQGSLPAAWDDKGHSPLWIS
jgi:hypothetical protein